MIRDQMAITATVASDQHGATVISLLGDGVPGAVLACLACEVEFVDGFGGVAVRGGAPGLAVGCCW